MTDHKRDLEKKVGSSIPLQSIIPTCPIHETDQLSEEPSTNYPISTTHSTMDRIKNPIDRGEELVESSPTNISDGTGCKDTSNGAPSNSTESIALGAAISTKHPAQVSDDVLTDEGVIGERHPGSALTTPGVDHLEEWLSNNIAEFINFIHTYSTSGDREKRWAIIRYVQRQASIFLGQSSTLHPSQVAIPFGSFTYGMYLPWASDLDIVITDKSFLDNPEGMMKRLAHHFSKQNNHCIQAEPVVVSRTRVPFIQLLLAPPHHARGLIDQSNCGLCRMGYSNLCPSHSPVSVQLSLSVKEHAGLVSTASVNHLVAHYPVIRGLVLVLKHILVSENLNSPFEGGLSSHSLIILVTAFVRHFHPHDHNISAPGLLFLQLLCWYGGVDGGRHRVFAEIGGAMQGGFDPASMTVDIKGDSDCFRPKAGAELTEMIYVVDPLDVSYNAARSMWRWADLKTTLTNAYWHVYSGKWWSAMGANSAQSSPSQPGSPVAAASIAAPVLLVAQALPGPSANKGNTTASSRKKGGGRTTGSRDKTQEGE